MLASSGPNPMGSALPSRGYPPLSGTAKVRAWIARKLCVKRVIESLGHGRLTTDHEDKHQHELSLK